MLSQYRSIVQPIEPEGRREWGPEKDEDGHDIQGMVLRYGAAGKGDNGVWYAAKICDLRLLQ